MVQPSPGPKEELTQYFNINGLANLPSHQLEYTRRNLLFQRLPLGSVLTVYLFALLRLPSIHPSVCLFTLPSLWNWLCISKSLPHFCSLIL